MAPESPIWAAATKLADRPVRVSPTRLRGKHLKYPYAYRLFGLCFRADVPFTENLAVCDDNADARGVRVSLRARLKRSIKPDAWRPVYCSTELDSSGTPVLVIEKDSGAGQLRMRYYDGTTFVVDSTGSEVHASWIKPSTRDDVATYLFGPVFGLLLYLRGLTCLHASAIAYGGRALVFVGPAEAGKSTLAAAFARKGYKVLTDDILGFNHNAQGIFAMPGLPRIGLWPQSVESLWGDADALPRQAPTWDKRYLDLEGQGLFQDSPLPVGAVYVLADRQLDAALRIEPLAGTVAMLAMIANKYVTRYFEREQDRRDFVLLSELAASVPIRRITRRNALTDLHATCEAILADFDALALAPA